MCRCDNEFHAFAHEAGGIASQIQEILHSASYDYETSLLALINFLRGQPDGLTDIDGKSRSLLISILKINPGPDIVGEFIRVFPDALPLNLPAFLTACQSSNVEVVRLLVRSVVKTNQGHQTCPYPWITMHHVSPSMTRAILEEYPQGIFQPCGTGTPSPIDDMIFRGEERARTDPSFWSKLMLMLMVQEHKIIRVDRPFHPIHAFITRLCTTKYFFQDKKAARSAIFLLDQWRRNHAGHFQISDCQGDFPIHVLFRSSCPASVGLFDTDFFKRACQDLARLILEVFPDSARIPYQKCSEGRRLPLHMALLNGWPCWNELITAAPETLTEQDCATSLLPFQVAACARREETRNHGTCALENIYGLLLQDPSCLLMTSAGRPPV